MKKTSLIVLSVLALGLAGCGRGTNSPASVVPPSSVVPEKKVELSVPGGTDVKVEKGAEYTIKVKVLSDADDLTVNFSCDEEQSIIGVPDNLTGVTSTKITGLKEGVAHVKATSVADPKVSVTITVTVTPMLSPLATVWSKVIEKKNYTLTSKDETGTLHQVVKAADNGLTWENGSGDGFLKADQAGTLKAYGYGLQEDGRVVTLLKGEDGAKTAGVAAKVFGVGLLSADNYLGMGDDAKASSVFYRYSKVGSWSFFGLQMISSLWLSSEKDMSNEYEIEGSSKDQNSAAVEMALWELVDFEGFMNFNPTGESIYDAAASVAEAIKTKIKVVADDNIEISVTKDNKEFTATLGDVGKTELDQPFTDALAKAADPLPALTDDLNAMKTAVETQKTPNYVLNYFNFASFGGGFYTYVTENYCFTFYPQAAEKLFRSLPQSSGFVKKADGLYNFTYQENVQSLTKAEAVAEGLGLDYKEATLPRGTSLTLKATLTPAVENATFAWTSSASDVASVDPATGEVKALKVGEADVTVTSGDKNAVCHVKVIDPADVTLGKKIADTDADTKIADILPTLGVSLNKSPLAEINTYYLLVSDGEGSYFSDNLGLYKKMHTFFDMPDWAMSKGSNQLQISIGLTTEGSFDSAKIDLVYQNADKTGQLIEDSYSGVPNAITHFGHAEDAVVADDLIKAL